MTDTLAQRIYDHLAENDPATVADLAKTFEQSTRRMRHILQTWAKAFAVVGKAEYRGAAVYGLASDSERPGAHRPKVERKAKPKRKKKQNRKAKPKTKAQQPSTSSRKAKSHKRTKPRQYTPLVTPERHAWRPPQRDRTNVRIVADPAQMDREQFVSACVKGFQDFMLSRSEGMR